jgi:hypothetical protein
VKQRSCPGGVVDLAAVLAMVVVVAGVALAAPGAARAQDEGGWPAWTASPRPDRGAASRTPLEQAALEACGAGDAALAEVARGVLARKLRGLPLPEPESLASMQRAAGEPHPWARTWAARARTLEAAAVLPRLASWLSGDRGLRRCGVAGGAAADGAQVLVVVAIDALADLSPLPTRARAGQWLTVEARMHVAASGARVVVLGPSGPRTVPSWIEGGAVRARFAPESPGELTVQVIADLASGPRPVIEAAVLADVDAPAASGNRDGAAHDVPPDDRAAPGEDVAAGTPDDDRLAAMIGAARAASSLPPLARDPRLDAAARGHAARMLAAGDLAHDAGDGDPASRIRAAGLDAREAGENVARAATLSLAHRATWASPSHRANLLGRYDRLGVAVVRDARGDAWIVEELARTN